MIELAPVDQPIGWALLPCRPIGPREVGPALHADVALPHQPLAVVQHQPDPAHDRWRSL